MLDPAVPPGTISSGGLREAASIGGLLGGALLIAVLLYAPALRGPFVFDDLEIRRTALFHATSLGEVARVFVTPGVPRKLGRASFALTHYFAGLRPEAYHAVNVVVHAANGVLLALLATALLGRLPPGHPYATHAQAIALAGTAVWLVHPVHTQAVAYIWQRYTGLSAFFVLASLLAYARARESSRHPRLLFSTAALCGVLALLTKENAGTLPLVVLLVELAFFATPGAASRRVLSACAALAAFAAVAAVFLGPRFLSMMAADFARRGFTPMERLLTETRVLLHYVTLLVLPHPTRLNMDYDFALSRSIVEPPTTLLSALVLAVMVVVSVVRWRKDRLLPFAVAWFLLHLAIESTIVPLDLAHEHRLYVPSMVPLVFATGLLFTRVRADMRMPALAVSLIVLSSWTIARNRLWADPVALLEDTAAKSPRKARVQANLAWAYLGVGRTEDAAAALERALAADPELVSHYRHLAAIHVRAGRAARARALLEEAVRRRPGDMQARVDLAAVCMRLGDNGAAAEQLRATVAILRTRAPEHAHAAVYEDLGRALLRAGDEASGRAAIELARTLNARPYPAPTRR